ncbi:hypothetical protein [Streptomyces sp. NPDC053720]|uniref:hypothetical protein n=1 Tax=Streptomyces sp. NPDC053720 TaxID=3154855 RepID=UPI00344784EE
MPLLPDAEVHHEIAYGKGGGQNSVDWIVVLPGLVLLLDAKAARPTTRLRLGPQQTFGDELNQKLGKAIKKQIPNTAKLIRDRHPQFAHIPHDRPMYGRAHSGGLGKRAGGCRRRDGTRSGGGDPGPGSSSRRPPDGPCGPSLTDGLSSIRSWTRRGRASRGARSTPLPQPVRLQSNPEQASP